MTIEITLKRNEILFDIHNRSHHECLNIADVEERYRKEAGSDKAEELNRFIAESVSELRSLLYRWIADDYRQDADDVPEDKSDIMFALSMSTRRAAGKAAALPEKMHDFIVNRTLGRFYASVGEADLSSLHAGISADAATHIEQVIYRRNEPII